MTDGDSLDNVQPIHRPERRQPQPKKKRRIPWWVLMLVMSGILLLCGGVLVAFALLGPLQVSSPPTPSPTLSPTATATVAVPTPTFPATVTHTPTTPAPTPTEAQPASPPAAEPGSFDVYVSAPNEETGAQTVQWVDVETDETVTTLTLRTNGIDPLRAGEFVYWVGPDDNPIRANTAGSQQTLDFAASPAVATYYDFLPSALGQYLGWVIIEGTRYSISLSRADGSEARVVAQGELPEGDTLSLVRVTDDGGQIFFSQRSPEVMDDLFGGFHNMQVLDVAAGEVSQLPGEPACGEFFACGARVSPDGAFVVRTIPAALSVTPVIVTNLVSGQVIARLGASTVPGGAQFSVGDPIFSPGGELIYIAGFGPTEFQRYQIVFADLVTGEQRVIAETGPDRHVPLGWTGGGRVLLTSRAGEYDTWQFNTVDNASRQIASLLFIGTITVEGP